MSWDSQETSIRYKPTSGLMVGLVPRYAVGLCSPTVLWRISETGTVADVSCYTYRKALLLDIG